jgi:hypothetical protein
LFILSEKNDHEKKILFQYTLKSNVKNNPDRKMSGKFTQDRAQEVILGTLIGDALALGPY